MQRLRSFRRIVPFLIGLFMVAQLAGVVSLEHAPAQASVAAATGHSPIEHAAHHHADLGEHRHAPAGIDNAMHGLAGSGNAGHCCALHAFLMGLAPIVLTAPVAIFGRGERLEIGAEVFTGLTGNRLDRPPRAPSSL